ncbi:MAG: mechanosensitive ion channel, partial [Proteobacteria bacterium]|nr:mechanosensitive ion channel [Pseudomonadota bacterium]
ENRPANDEALELTSIATDPLAPIESHVPTAELEEENKELFIAQTTNITMFRHYIKQYLGSHSQIHKKSFSFIVRTLDPTPNGLPIELYAFTKDTKWDRYEEIQSDIFEHLLAIMPSFKLRAFQLVSQT